jgi:hypothetical protein
MSDVLKEISRDVYRNGNKELTTEDIFEVIQTLRPGCRFDASFGGGGVTYRHFWDPNNLPAPTIEEIEEEIIYQKECKDYYQYAYDRCHEYPDGFEQFDMLWHAINDGVDLKRSEWFNTIKAIKEKFPKPDGEPPVKNNK